MVRATRLQQILEFFLKLLAGIVQATHYCALRALHYAADLFVREAFNFAQEYDGFVIGGQLADRLSDSVTDLARLRVLKRIVSPLLSKNIFVRLSVVGRTEAVLQADRRVAPRPAPEVD